MTLPVLEETAEVPYHSVHRKINLRVEAEGKGEESSFESVV
jgi:hypothetical protein